MHSDWLTFIAWFRYSIQLYKCIVSSDATLQFVRDIGYCRSTYLAVVRSEFSISLIWAMSKCWRFKGHNCLCKVFVHILLLKNLTEKRLFECISDLTSLRCCDSRWAPPCRSSSSYPPQFRGRSSWTVCPDDYITYSMFGHLQKWTFAQYHKK